MKARAIGRVEQRDNAGSDLERIAPAGAQPVGQSKGLLPARSQREINVNYRKSGRQLGTASDVRHT
jgi:hypothetical protein